MTFLRDMELSTPNRWKRFLNILKRHNIDVLRINSADTDDDVDIDAIMIAEEEEVDVENIDLSVPEGVSIEDPVRMYLKGNRKSTALKC